VKYLSHERYPTRADVDEMIARGYCPSTIEEAEKAFKTGRIEEISALIREAFDGVTLGSGVGLREAQGLDDYADAKTRLKYRAGDEKLRWDRIPIKELTACTSSLSFFDAEGMRFHLPAFLIADILGAGRGMTDYSLTSGHYEQFSLLSRAQRTAVREFLLRFTDSPNSRKARRALEEYWIE